MSNVIRARMNRTKLWFVDRPAFFTQLVLETEALVTKCKKLGKYPALRLNGTSDIIWEKQAPWLLRRFSDIQWYEVHSKSITLHATPESIADLFQQHIEQSKRTFVFTSATLSVQQSFTHFMQRLGINNATSKYLDSPFDYQKQSLCYLPQCLPQPNMPDYIDKVVAAAIPVINYDPDSIGRTTALTKINVLWATIQRNIKTLTEIDKSAFVKEA